MNTPKSWRPEDWNNPYPERAEPSNSLSDKLMYARIAYEAGADAMLEALKLSEEDKWSRRIGEMMRKAREAKVIGVQEDKPARYPLPQNKERRSRIDAKDNS